MRMGALVFSIITLLSTAACLPLMNPGAYGAQGAFTGTFTTQGGSMTLQESNGQVSGTLSGGNVTGKVTGVVSGGMLSGQITLSTGESTSFTAVATATGLDVNVPGRGVVAFARSGGGAGGGTVDPSMAPSSQMADTLAGTWWHWHGSSLGDPYASSGTSSSTSFERTIELCRDGRFFDSSNRDISVTAKSDAPGYDGWGNPTKGSETSTAGNYQGGGAGRWTASGDDMTGQLQLAFHDGTVETHQYVFKKRGGGDIELDGQWFGYANDKGGQCQ
jgi:hypothetical protein